MSAKVLCLFLMITTACGFKNYGEASKGQGRSVASGIYFNDEVDEKLNALNCYYLIGQKNLQLFDKLIHEKSLKQLYQTTSYLNILAVKKQVEKIELELTDLHQEAIHSGPKKKAQIEFKIKSFSQISPFKELAMSNLKQKLGMKMDHEFDINDQTILKEYKEVETIKEFQVYKKNIEHLSHLMSMQTRKEVKLNNEKYQVGSHILKILKDKKLKTTFVQSIAKSNKFIDSRFCESTFASSVRKSSDKNILINISWNIDTIDWMTQTSGMIIKRTKRLMEKTSQNAGIILFHDVHLRSIKASNEIANYLMMEKRRTCTVGKIFNDINEGMAKVCLQN